MQIPKQDLYPKAAKTESVKDVPIVTGPSGLTGRPSVRPVEPPEEPIGFEEDGTPVYASTHEPAEGPSLPSGCIRKLALPPGRDECGYDCPGRQRDGGCLADLVRTVAGGAEWTVEIDKDGYWNLRVD